MKPAKPKPRAQPGRRRDYVLRKDPYIRVLWRVTYLDADFGQCFAWAPTKYDAHVLRNEIREHYAFTGDYVPEVFVGRVNVPTGNRTQLATWLTVHAACGTRRAPQTHDM